MLSRAARPPALAMLMLSLVFAGCFGAEPPAEPPIEADGDVRPAIVPPPEQDYDFSAALELDHDHWMPDIHAASHYLNQTSYSDLTPGTITSTMVAGMFNEVDVCGGLAAIGSFAGNRGFTLANVTNATDISAFAQFGSAGITWDAHFSEDCETLFVALDQGPLPDDAPTLPSLSPTGLEDTGRAGILIVDVTSPRAPREESYNPVGPTHNVYSLDIDGATYVFTEDVDIFRVTGTPDERTLEAVASVPGLHDAHVARHPETGVPYLFTATENLEIYDVRDPAAPEQVASFALPEGHEAWHEQTPAPALIDGRWILVAAAENMEGLPTPFSIINITDPSEPGFLSSWTLPGDFSSYPAEQTNLYSFSPHNVAIREDGRIALAHFHAGVWVIDASTQARQEAPVTLGFAQPMNIWESRASVSGIEVPIPAMPVPFVQSPGTVKTIPYAPYVWGADWTPDGTLIVADLNSGLYAYGVA